jgi:hypothetical protein
MLCASDQQKFQQHSQQQQQQGQMHHQKQWIRYSVSNATETKVVHDRAWREIEFETAVVRESVIAVAVAATVAVVLVAAAAVVVSEEVYSSKSPQSQSTWNRYDSVPYSLQPFSAVAFSLWMMQEWCCCRFPSFPRRTVLAIREDDS